LRGIIYPAIGSVVVVSFVSAFTGIEPKFVYFGIGALFIIAVIFGSLNLEEEKYEEWYGEMHCSSCGYSWQSRRNSPPAKCANCSSKTIEPCMVQKTRFVSKK